MKTVKAYYDGKTIVLPDDFAAEPGEVVIVVNGDGVEAMALSEAAFAAVWDNPEDAEYDDI